MGRIQTPAGWAPYPDFAGLEDARALSWRGRLHLLGTLNAAGEDGRLINRVALVRLDESGTAAEAGAVLDCQQQAGGRAAGGAAAAAGGGLQEAQKNFMPLVLGGELYLVLQTAPLLVGRVDYDSLGCTLLDMGGDVRGSGSAGSEPGSAVASGLDLDAVGGRQGCAWRSHTFPASRPCRVCMAVV